MNTLDKESIHLLCESILALQTEEECYAFLRDICTLHEIEDMAQRLSVASLLMDGLRYQEIAEKYSVSTATISRVSTCLKYGAGYSTVLGRLKGAEQEADK